MQVGNFALPATLPMWEMSNMAEEATLRGRALYDALMQIKPAGLVETDWAVGAGVNRGFFSNLKSSDISPRSDTLHKILTFVKCREADLYHAANITEERSVVLHSRISDVEKSSAFHSDGEVVKIQKLDLSLSMGPGTLIDDHVEAELLNFDLNFVRIYTRASSDRLRLVTGIGDSMDPTLKWGDLILIDTTDRMLSKQDGIYWINLYGAAGIKRLRAVGPRHVLIKSDNPAVDDQEVAAEDLRIEGRAIWATRGL